MDMSLLDKLQLMLKLKERIRSMKKSPENQAEVVRLEKLMASLQANPEAKYI